MYVHASKRQCLTLVFSNNFRRPSISTRPLSRMSSVGLFLLWSTWVTYIRKWWRKYESCVAAATIVRAWHRTEGVPNSISMHVPYVFGSSICSVEFTAAVIFLFPPRGKEWKNQKVKLSSFVWRFVWRNPEELVLELLLGGHNPSEFFFSFMNLSFEGGVKSCSFCISFGRHQRTSMPFSAFVPSLLPCVVAADAARLLFVRRDYGFFVSFDVATHIQYK